jgi:CheY-like chemotaxis protein
MAPGAHPTEPRTEARQDGEDEETAMRSTGQDMAKARTATQGGQVVRLPDDLVACDRRRLLVVDDEEAMVTLYRVVLTEAFPGTHIDAARHGADAVDMFSSGHPAVILMDLHMPVMDGRMAFDVIRKMCMRWSWEVPTVVFCSGYIPSEDIRRALSWGGRYAVLNKPVNTDLLVKEIGQALATETCKVA